MAEERLIDDDKDRKYKIRINENGEEELVIIPDADGEEQEELLGLEIPEFDGDDEDAAVMTPEQLAARKKAQEEEEARNAAKLQELLLNARRMFDGGDYDGAAYELDKAQKINGENGEVLALKLMALSQNFTEYTLINQCAETADDVKKFCSQEQKNELLYLSEPLKNRLENVRAETEKLSEENEQKKDERRISFTAKRKKSLIAFSATALPFLIFLVVTISVACTIMYAREDGAYLIMTIAFGVVTLAFFIATLFTAHRLWEAIRNLKLNERNSSTKLGREYEAKKDELDKLTRIYGAFNGVCEEEEQ